MKVNEVDDGGKSQAYRPAVVVKRRWFPIPGYEDFYEASDQGEIRSVGIVLRGRYRPREKPMVLRPAPRNSRSRGLRVTLAKDGNCQAWGVDELVLRAFRGAPPEGKEWAVHSNGDVADNRFANLRWGTKAEADAQRPGSRIRESWRNLKHVGDTITIQKDKDGGGP